MGDTARIGLLITVGLPREGSVEDLAQTLEALVSASFPDSQTVITWASKTGTESVDEREHTKMV